MLIRCLEIQTSTGNIYGRLIRISLAIPVLNYTATSTGQLLAASIRFLVIHVTVEKRGKKPGRKTRLEDASKTLDGIPGERRATEWIVIDQRLTEEKSSSRVNGAPRPNCRLFSPINHINGGIFTVSPRSASSRIDARYKTDQYATFAPRDLHMCICKFLGNAVNST